MRTKLKKGFKKEVSEFIEMETESLTSIMYTSNWTLSPPAVS